MSTLSNSVLSHLPGDSLTKLNELKDSISESPRYPNVVSMYYIIDASICGSANFREQFDALLNEPSNAFSLTNVTVTELHKLTAFNDSTGQNANYILRQATSDATRFLTVRVDDLADTPDSCIVKYARSNNLVPTTLLTSDKEMSLLARSEGVAVDFWKSAMAFTLKNTYLENGSLKYQTYPTHNFFARVYSGESSHSNETVSLDYDDVVCLAVLKYDQSKCKSYISFVVSKIVSLSTKNNCVNLWHRKLFPDENLDQIYLPEEFYRDFLKEAKDHFGANK